MHFFCRPYCVSLNYKKTIRALIEFAYIWLNEYPNATAYSCNKNVIKNRYNYYTNTDFKLLEKTNCKMTQCTALAMHKVWGPFSNTILTLSDKKIEIKCICWVR